MKRINLVFALITLCSIATFAQPGKVVIANQVSMLPPSKVDFDAFDSLTREVKEYRKTRLVNLDKFLAMSKEENTIILDTRSTEMYNRKHVKGAIHLDFTDFTQANLDSLIPSPDTRILIYCNNNFDNDPVNLATKSARPVSFTVNKRGRRITAKPPLTLALNIPTFINLYGYGYKNVYELSDFVSVFNPAIQFEGTAVLRQLLQAKVAAATTPSTR